MPTYQYACTACDHRFEAVQSFSDPSLSECPQCTGKLRKVFSSVGIVFKGSGFYRTDSRSGASSVAAPGKESTSTSSESGGGTSDSGTSSGSSEKSSGSSEKKSGDKAPAAAPAASSTPKAAAS